MNEVANTSCPGPTHECVFHLPSRRRAHAHEKFAITFALLYLHVIVEISFVNKEQALKIALAFYDHC